MIEAIIALVALSLMEIVLGIDNIVFISILTSKLPIDQQSLGRKLGLALALITRLLLLGSVFWIAQLITPIFSLDKVFPAINQLQSYFTVDSDSLTSQAHGHASISTSPNTEPELEAPTLDEHAWREFVDVSWRDIILLTGGLFLIYNSVREIHSEVESRDHGSDSEPVKAVNFRGLLVKIAIMDVVFSLDSVITAVGMADQLWIMFTAVIIAVGVMILFADQVGNFVDNNPTIKMLALNFLLLIGVMLVAEGIGTPISKGYIYFAMAFSLLVESFNIHKRKKLTASPPH